MNISRFRRKLNDSDIGHAINSTIPGILVESFFRYITGSSERTIGYDSHYSHRSLLYITIGKEGVMKRKPIPMKPVLDLECALVKAELKLGEHNSLYL